MIDGRSHRRSGLTAHGDAINVVGDNIANVSTVGFKSGSANFNDVLWIIQGFKGEPYPFADPALCP